MEGGGGEQHREQPEISMAWMDAGAQAGGGMSPSRQPKREIDAWGTESH